jgi:hypothetical protein
MSLGVNVRRRRGIGCFNEAKAGAAAPVVPIKTAIPIFMDRNDMGDRSAFSDFRDGTPSP